MKILAPLSVLIVGAMVAAFVLGIRPARLTPERPGLIPKGPLLVSKRACHPSAYVAGDLDCGGVQWHRQAGGFGFMGRPRGVKPRVPKG